MRRILVLMILILACVPALQADPTALLVFYRSSHYTGSALKPSIYLDGREIARLENGRYFSLFVEPGQHQLSSSMKEAPLQVEAKAGEATYLEMVIMQGTWRGGGRLIPTPAGDASAAIAKLKQLERKWISDPKASYETQVAAASDSDGAPAAAGANAAAPGDPPVEAEVEVVITSIPDAAEIEIDGQFVGSTTSNLALRPGEHVITVKKSGYKDWSRKVKLSNGSIHIAAELEELKTEAAAAPAKN
jgi:PEGA domain/Protein of unknown function (DUF2846)